MRKTYILVFIGISLMNFLFSDSQERVCITQAPKGEEKGAHASSSDAPDELQKGALEKSSSEAPVSNKHVSSKYVPNKSIFNKQVCEKHISKKSTLKKSTDQKNSSKKCTSQTHNSQRYSSDLQSDQIASEVRREKKIDNPKKRILIFSSKGGGGHTAVSNGLCSYLKDTYEVSVVNIFQEVISSLDTLSTLTFGRITGEDLYNFCMVSRWNRLLNKYAEHGSYLFESKQYIVEKIIADYFKYDQPDLLISVVPFVNGALLSVSKKLKMPFLVITNDFDTSNYVVGIKNPSYEKFRYTLAFEDQLLRDKIKEAHIPDNQIVISGFPLRPSFYGSKETTTIKKKFNIPPNKPVVMVFMGAAGSLMTPRFIRTLAKVAMPMHIVVCLGRNERLKRVINKILLPPEITISVIGFTDKIAELMSISSVVITKTGPGSSCESLESCLPMIHDETQGVLAWEQLSTDFMERHGFAEKLKSFTDLPGMLPKYLKDSTYSDKVKSKMRNFPRKRFDRVIGPLVEEMLNL